VSKIGDAGCIVGQVELDSLATSYFSVAIPQLFNSILDPLERTEPELGERPILASLSLGEERTFILKHKRKKALKPVPLKLASGSLLLMKGDTQRYWKHGIDKETRPCGPRVNLTFRRILT
jgi:hypothetical protein